MKNWDEITNDLRQYIGSNFLFGDTSFKNSDNLLDLGVDSLQLVDLIQYLEQKWDIYFQEKENFSNEVLQSIDSLIKYLQSTL